MSQYTKWRANRLTVPLMSTALRQTHSSSSSDHSALKPSLSIGHFCVAFTGSLGTLTHFCERVAIFSADNLVDCPFCSFPLGDVELGPASAVSRIHSCASASESRYRADDVRQHGATSACGRRGPQTRALYDSVESASPCGVGVSHRRPRNGYRIVCTEPASVHSG